MVSEWVSVGFWDWERIGSDMGFGCWQSNTRATELLRYPLCLSIDMSSRIQSLFVTGKRSSQLLGSRARQATQTATTPMLSHPSAHNFYIYGPSDNKQRISIFAASAPRPTDENENTVLDKITYENVASIIPSSDNPTHQMDVTLDTVYAHSAQRFRVRHLKQRKIFATHELTDLKGNSICCACGAKCHWVSDGLYKSSHASIKKSVVKPQNAMDNRKNEKSGNSSGNVAFFIANVSNDATPNITRPLVGEGAPYSGLGVQELLRIAEDIMIGWKGNLDPLSEGVRHGPYWQYGNDNHYSTRRRIIGPIVVSMVSDMNERFDVTHVVIERSSQWVIGRNVTRKTDIIHLNGNYIHFMHLSGNSYSIVQPIDHGDHIFIHKHRFFHGNFVSVNDTDTRSLCTQSATVSKNDIGNII